MKKFYLAIFVAMFCLTLSSARYNKLKDVFKSVDRRMKQVYSAINIFNNKYD